MVKYRLEFKNFLLKNSLDFNSLISTAIEPGLYIYCNPRNFDTLRSFEDFDSVFYRLGENFSQKIFDGLKLRRSAVGVRQSFDFSSLAGLLLETFAINRYRVLFIGASYEELIVFSDKISALFPNLEADYEHGYLPLEHYLNLVSKLKPDVVVVGLGNVKQEKLGFLLKELEGATLRIFTCGGFIGQEGRNLHSFYPTFFAKYNIRFVYRFITQPHTLWRVLRYYGPFAVKCVLLKLVT